MSELSDSRIGSDYASLHRRNLLLMREVDHLSTLREIGLAISGSLELRETLPLIANVVQGALDLRRLAIYELLEERGCLRPIVAKYGDDLILADRLEEETESRRGTPFGECIDARRVLLQPGPPYPAAYVPLFAKHKALGVMLLEAPRSDEPFSSDDAQLFRDIGAQVAIALQNNQLYALAVNDGLTGLFVRRYFDLQLKDAFAQGERYGRLFSMLLFDIDHFKKFNDTHGHQTGDLVLQQFAQLLRESTRESDICCRYGGEEMAIILPETPMEEAHLLAAKLCKKIRGHAFTGTDGQALSVTSSIGVAEFGKGYQTPEDILRACDDALYEAKRNGRNRVEIALRPGG
ncbi:MAG: diguanylate cyclase [Candidatus Hydrogenedens sp.]|nr:diguanylate cyclase [Candidatus Hydrogenedens sp.]